MKRIFCSLICMICLNVFSEETTPEENYYNQLLLNFEEKNWEQVYSLSHLMYKRYPHSGQLADVYYYWGVSAYNLKHYEKASECFSTYLEKNTQPRFFDQVIQYKFSIAEKFRNGEKSHLFGWNVMPRWMPCRSEALEIYNEIIATLPHHELAARSLYGKGLLLAYFEDFKDSIDTLELLIQRFPKHDLAPQCFAEIGNVYLLMAKSKQQDPTLIDQSAINIKKFRMAFPSDNRIATAEKTHNVLKGAFAENLYDMASFFQNRKKLVAAELYYKKILATFPESDSALKASRELEIIEKKNVQ